MLEDCQLLSINIDFQKFFWLKMLQVLERFSRRYLAYQWELPVLHVVVIQVCSTLAVGLWCEKSTESILWKSKVLILCWNFKFIAIYFGSCNSSSANDNPGGILILFYSYYNCNYSFQYTIHITINMPYDIFWKVLQSHNSELWCVNNAIVVDKL